MKGLDQVVRSCQSKGTIFVVLVLFPGLADVDLEAVGEEEEEDDHVGPPEDEDWDGEEVVATRGMSEVGLTSPLREATRTG